MAQSKGHGGRGCLSNTLIFAAKGQKRTGNAAPNGISATDLARLRPVSSTSLNVCRLRWRLLEIWYARNSTSPNFIYRLCVDFFSPLSDSYVEDKDAEEEVQNKTKMK